MSETRRRGKVIAAETWRARGTVALARWLLGKYLVRRHPDGRIDTRIIVETEAYDGERDQACHARVGRILGVEALHLL